MSGDFDLSGPYGTGSYGSGSRPHVRNSIRSLGSLNRKSAAANYNPILTPQEEYNSGSFQFQQNDPDPRATRTLSPVVLGKFGTDLVIEIILCTFTLGVSAPFIWLAITMAKYDGETVTDSDSEYIHQATSTVRPYPPLSTEVEMLTPGHEQASTLFTILFAAVLGTTLKRFATYRLERGIKIGLLEQVMQSRTFFAAVTTQLSFRAFNITAVLLLLSWAFSPLGSQASLRLVTVGRRYTSDSGLLSHVDTITNQVFDSVSGVDSLLTSLKPSYISSVLGPTSMKNSTVDLFGNVKIPWLVENAEKDPNGWITLTPSTMTEGSFSSLVGVPMSSLENRNSSFVIETTYMNLDCNKPKDETLVNINVNVTKAANGTFSGPNTTVDSTDFKIYPFWQVAMNQFVSSAYFYGYPEQLVNVSDADIPQATFLFQTRGPQVSRCAISQVYVQSNVSCLAVSDGQLPLCAVQAQRKSPNKHAPSTITLMSFPSTFTYTTQQWILATDPLLSSGYSTLSEYYLQNTSTPSILNANERDYADYANVTAQEFSQRLGQLLNTWVLASQTSADTMNFLLNYQNVTALYTDGRDVYIISWGWLTVYSVAIGVMLIAAFFTIWCAFHTTIPDVLSYCSSLTRDSRFFDFAKGGSALDGVVRAKMLRDVEVKLGEVASSRRNSDELVQGGFVNEIRRQNEIPSLAIAPPDQLRPPRRGMMYA
jgi:hypothetical protein